MEDDQPKYRLLVDKEKAALNGISEDDIARTMPLASAGYQAGLLHADSAKEDVPLMRAARPRRAAPTWSGFRTSKWPAATGRLVRLSELVAASRSWSRTRASTTRI